MKYLSLLAVLMLALFTACQPADPPLPTAMQLATFTPSATVLPLTETPVSSLAETILPSATLMLESPTTVEAASGVVAELTSPTLTATPLPTLTETLIPTETLAPTLVPTEVASSPEAVITTVPPSLTATATLTSTPTATLSPSPSFTFTPTFTETPSSTPSPSKTLAPTVTPDMTQTEIALLAEAGIVTARVNTEALNVRNGPGETFDVIAYLDEGIIVTILGMSADAQWLWIEYSGGLHGWIYSGFMEILGAVADIPVTEPTALPEFARLEGLTWIQQQFNNCAATAVTIALTYYGGTTDQNVARGFLRPTNTRDVSVDIQQMVDYVNQTQQGLRSLWRMGGNWTVIRQLVAAGFPVIIETSVEVHDPQPGWAGHNRVVMGYDGTDILTYDSYLGHGNFQGYRVPQNELDELWRHMNRHYMVVYPIEREAEVAYIMGELWFLPNSVQRAYDIALAEMKADPANVFAQFNLGATYTALGQYEEAAAAFDVAFAQGGIPFRIFWYQFSVFEAYYHTGRYSEVIYFAREALLNMGGQGAEELYYWLGLGYAGRGQFDQAKVQLENAITFNPYYTQAQAALDQINSGAYKPPV